MWPIPTLYCQKCHTAPAVHADTAFCFAKLFRWHLWLTCFCWFYYVHAWPGTAQSTTTTVLLPALHCSFHVPVLPFFDLSLFA